MTLQAGAVLWPRERRWRGIVDDVVEKTGTLGTYQSGQRVSRCEHHHRDEAAAQACGERQLRGLVKERAGDTGNPLSRSDVAALIGVTPSTISAYLRDGLMPQPDGHVGKSPWWKRTTIQQWVKARPGRGRKKTQ